MIYHDYMYYMQLPRMALVVTLILPLSLCITLGPGTSGHGTWLFFHQHVAPVPYCFPPHGHRHGH